MESLLEFTREPALMTDVYINYDCDVQCTNLFETICHSLSTHALPRDGMVSEVVVWYNMDYFYSYPQERWGWKARVRLPVLL